MKVTEIKKLEMVTSLLARLRTKLGPVAGGELRINISATQEGSLLLLFYVGDADEHNDMSRLSLEFGYEFNDDLGDHQDCLVLTEFRVAQDTLVQFYKERDLQSTLRVVDDIAHRITGILAKKETE